MEISISVAVILYLLAIGDEKESKESKTIYIYRPGDARVFFRGCNISS
jgi:hypothetical protein